MTHLHAHESCLYMHLELVEQFLILTELEAQILLRNTPMTVKEIAYELGTGEIRPLAGIVMERKDGSGWMMAGAVVVVVAGGAWWFIRRRKRLTVNE